MRHKSSNILTNHLAKWIELNSEVAMPKCRLNLRFVKDEHTYGKKSGQKRSYNGHLRVRPSSSMMGYSPIAKKSPIDPMGKNIWGKLMGKIYVEN